MGSRKGGKGKASARALPDDEFDDYVDHPRYGRHPRVTGLNPVRPDRFIPGERLVIFHWHSPEKDRIPNTAIVADQSRQIFTTFPVTHYFDVRRKCQGCGRRFLFFAEEQQYWYETLQFSIEAGCIRCVPCRRKEQGKARQRERYEELFHVQERSPSEDLEMAECCLALIEASIFGRRQLERVRMLIKGVDSKSREKILKRVRALESPP